MCIIFYHKVRAKSCKLVYKRLSIGESNTEKIFSEKNFPFLAVSVSVSVFTRRPCVTKNIFEKFAKNRKMHVFNLGFYQSKDKRQYFIRMYMDFLITPPFPGQITRKLTFFFFPFYLVVSGERERERSSQRLGMAGQEPFVISRTDGSYVVKNRTGSTVIWLHCQICQRV